MIMIKRQKPRAVDWEEEKLGVIEKQSSRRHAFHPKNLQRKTKM